MGQNCLCQLAGQPAEESFQLEKMEKGGGDQPHHQLRTSEMGSKQRTQGDVVRRDMVIKVIMVIMMVITETGLKT